MGNWLGSFALWGIARQKNKRKDDLIDPTRYIVVKVPWDWSIITGVMDGELSVKVDSRTFVQREIDERREKFSSRENAEAEFQAEFAEIQEMYDG